MHINGLVIIGITHLFLFLKDIVSNTAVTFVYVLIRHIYPMAQFKKIYVKWLKEIPKQ